MSVASEIRTEVHKPPSDPPWANVLRWISTNNPFYVISAGLFLFGLRMSFGPQIQEGDVGVLTGGLAVYTVLLAGTSWLLVRFLRVWDDARTVLLLVVLMFLATSVTFDDLFHANPNLALGLDLGGFLFAVAISEAVLRGIRLDLPIPFRGPYYLLLGLFFLYPLALEPFLKQPKSDAMQFGLFLFSTVCGLAFLTLIPAIRRGAEGVKGNGSPWPWPLYPWTLFAMIAWAVPARAYLMCYSLHWLDMAQGTRTIFGPYFFAPFLILLAVLLVEFAIVHRKGASAALLMPLVAVVVAFLGHQDNPVYLGFLGRFRETVGGDPLAVTLTLTAAFYVYAGLRGLSASWVALSAVLTALSLAGTDGLRDGVASPVEMMPLLAAAAVLLVRGAVTRSPLLLSIGGAQLIACAFANLPIDPALRMPIAVHLAIALLATLGAIFDDVTARLLSRPRRRGWSCSSSSGRSS